MFLKAKTLRSRHAGERLIIKVTRHLAAPPPAPMSGRAMLAHAGVSERGTSALAAAIALIPEAAVGIRLHGIASPFVSDGEIILLGELARRQRINPRPFCSGAAWPLSVEPSIDILLDVAAAALGDVGLLIDHRTITNASDLARRLVPNQGYAA